MILQALSHSSLMLFWQFQLSGKKQKLIYLKATEDHHTIVINRLFQILICFSHFLFCEYQ
jgi:hypothetical protein